MDTEYKIIGPGDKETNPIRVEVDGRETSASITYTVRTSESADCNTFSTDNTYYYIIPLEPLKCDADDKVNLVTSTTVNIGDDSFAPLAMLTLWYQVTQKKYDCEKVCAGNGECDVVRAWTVPYFIGDDLAADSDVTIYYEYFYTKTDPTTKQVCGREHKIGTKVYKKSALPANPIEFTTDEGCIINVTTASTIDGCTSDSSVDLTVSFTTVPEEIPAVGGDVTIVCSYKRVEIDKKCNRKVRSGSFTIEEKIDECKNDSLECCFDHDIFVTVTVANIIQGSKTTGDNISVYYNNVKVTTETIQVPVRILARHDGVCSDACMESVTYCVTSPVRIYYEKKFNTDTWGEEGVGSVPCTGGRIKVKWEYMAYSKCTEPVNLTYEEIWMIGGCDESTRPKTYEVLFKKQDKEHCGNYPSEKVGEDDFNLVTVQPEQDPCPCGGAPAPCDCGAIDNITDPEPECNCESVGFELDDPEPSCDCEGFEFDDPEPSCDCEGFEFDDPEPSCDCEGFEFDVN